MLPLPLEVTPGHVDFGWFLLGFAGTHKLGAHTCCHNLIIPGISGTVLSTFLPLGAPFLTQ